VSAFDPGLAVILVCGVVVVLLVFVLLWEVVSP
jgi:hypothetical protein